MVAQLSSEEDTGSSHRNVVFIIVSFGLFMASVDQTVVATALTTIQRDLHAEIQWSSWTITIYALGQLLILPVAGKLSDMYGSKRVFLTATIVFTAASLLCGLAQNIYALVGLRALQAIGGGSFMPAASGIVSDHFGRDRDRALGLFSTVFPIGGLVGPILGGVMVTYFSWRDIFFVNIPIGIGLVVLGLVFLPTSRPRSDSGRVDIRGIALVCGLLLGAMLGITELGDGASPLSPQFAVPEIVAVAALCLFIRHAKRADRPFISMRHLTGRGFGIMNILNFLWGCTVVGFAALVPVYAQDRFGIAPLASGTLLTARALGMVCVAGVATFALRRTGYRLPIALGFSIISAGFAMMFISIPGVSPYLWLSISAGLTGIGMGLSSPASNNAVLRFAGDDLAGVVGLRGMFKQAGAIMSVSVVTAIAARSDDPGRTLGFAFVILAVVLACSLPAIVLRVPEHRGAW
jgi:EmrB/QacA subfamily drug resistance transporter